MDLREKALALHRDNKGKIAIQSKVELKDKDDLGLAYTPGVAEPCKEIHRDKELVWEYTFRGNVIAVVTDGSAVLGLGDIGPEAALPVMEGKCVLFKKFGNVDAFPICLGTQDVDEIVQTVKAISPTLGGVNLEDISAPRCFEIEKRLKEETDIPIFHDDQHGTAVVVAAAMINALKVVGKELEDVKIVVNGAGAAGIAISNLLMNMGAGDVILCDSRGALYKGRSEGMNPYKEEIAERTNKKGAKTLAEALEGADVFIGVSVGGVLTQDMVRSMAKDQIVLAMANPVPEIYPDEAKAAGAKVVGTGRSDFPNQINNVLAFPGIFRGALDVRAKDITEEMKIAAAYALASLVSEEELSPDHIITDVFDPRVAPTIAKAVAEAWKHREHRDGSDAPTA
ncbi:MAG TPA: malic enzyme-like NAD(P)-binding protein [Bacillota bacterium]|nr:NAD-dependent malic enzyme [Candidatus Fermentithermobacillaceae bacterium]HOB30333.1 malic enzyme-like NAD(P)-binding protein [Bacillota bacterium]HOK64418.1 malic enzyme-like NAD(P)-binding protein [Bacillota bacterium]HOL12018.1 malic enzyme-like NAD(P)-binding protein [Bacillota bacterium]HOQ02943.1 malic enzyme-like NAD(P)-binding protein [Bacillota bacterium]